MKRLMLAVAISLNLFGASARADYSEGSRVGVITKLSKKGLFCKSWEGELNMGGFKNKKSDKGTNVVANIFEFTIPDDKPEILEAANQAMDIGADVRLSYTQSWFYDPCSSSTGYYVSGIKIIKLPLPE